MNFTLVPVTHAHMDAIAEWYKDIHELALIESHLPMPVDLEALIKAWNPDLEPRQPRGSYVYSLLDENGDNIGFTGIQDINYAYGNAVVFIFISKAFRRLGLASRAIAMMLDLGFRQLRLHRVSTYVHANNEPSLQLIDRLGFQPEGCLREACFYNGQHFDVNVVGMLATEWQQIRPSLNDAMNPEITLQLGDSDCQDWCWPAHASDECH